MSRWWTVAFLPYLGVICFMGLVVLGVGKLNSEIKKGNPKAVVVNVVLLIILAAHFVVLYFIGPFQAGQAEKIDYDYWFHKAAAIVVIYTAIEKYAEARKFFRERRQAMIVTEQDKSIKV